MDHRKTRSALFIGAWLLLVMFQAAGPVSAGDLPNAVYGHGRGRLVVATGSPGALGLLQALAVPFCQAGDCRILWYKKGSGAALNFLKAGKCDLIMVHAPAAEKRAVAEGWAADRTLIGGNRFIIVGPKSDPAGIAGAETAPEAYGLIARSRSRFYSRGDNSGTHKRELEIWRLCGIRPAGDWYVTTHAFMGATLLLADRNPGYFMTDDSTYYVKQARLNNLVPLFAKDPILVNVYHALRANPAKYPARANTLARRFIAFVAGRRGQAIIHNYGLKRFGRSLYRDAAGAEQLLAE